MTERQLTLDDAANQVRWNDRLRTIRDAKVTANQKLLLFLINDHAGRAGSWEMTWAALAREAGLAVNTVKANVKRLAADYLVSAEPVEGLPPGQYRTRFSVCWGNLTEWPTVHGPKPVNTEPPAKPAPPSITDDPPRQPLTPPPSIDEGPTSYKQPHLATPIKQPHTATPAGGGERRAAERARTPREDGGGKFVGKWKSQTLTGADLSRVDCVRELYQHALDRLDFPEDSGSRRYFFAAAAHARGPNVENPGALFSTIIRKRRWVSLSEEAKREAASVCRHLFAESRPSEGLLPRKPATDRQAEVDRLMAAFAGR